MKIAVSAESTVDLTKELSEKYDIKILPYTIVMDGKEYKDGEIMPEDLFKTVDETKILPKTTALNAFEYGEWFDELLKEYDAVIHIGLSSGITSSLSHAEAAAKERNGVYVVDSLSLSTGIALSAIYARELADGGTNPEAIAKKVSERTAHVQASFVIERLDYLYKGGRCNSIQLLGANVFKIRPSVWLNKGKMEMHKKYRGNMDAVIEKYCADTLAEFNTPDLDKVFITYTTATPEMVSKARQACENAGFKNIYETRAGATISSHCGAHTLGILYFNDGKQ